MILGALGSGFAFLLFGTLLKRTGTVRALIPTYFTPIVGTFLGVLFNDEKVKFKYKTSDGEKIIPEISIFENLDVLDVRKRNFVQKLA